MNHNSVTDIAICTSLRTSVTVREHLACREQFINLFVMRNIWTIFGRQSILDNFWTAFFVSIGLGIGHICEMSEPYTSSGTMPVRGRADSLAYGVGMADVSELGKSLFLWCDWSLSSALWLGDWGLLGYLTLRGLKCPKIGRLVMGLYRKSSLLTVSENSSPVYYGNDGSKIPGNLHF